MVNIFLKKTFFPKSYDIMESNVKTRRLCNFLQPVSKFVLCFFFSQNMKSSIKYYFVKKIYILLTFHRFYYTGKFHPNILQKKKERKKPWYHGIHYYHDIMGFIHFCITNFYFATSKQIRFIRNMKGGILWKNNTFQPDFSDSIILESFPMIYYRLTMIAWDPRQQNPRFLCSPPTSLLFYNNHQDKERTLFSKE